MQAGNGWLPAAVLYTCWRWGAAVVALCSRCCPAAQHAASAAALLRSSPAPTRANPSPLAAKPVAAPSPRLAHALAHTLPLPPHAANEERGATDTGAVAVVPPRWRPFLPDVPQIPYTFPPRCALCLHNAALAAVQVKRSPPAPLARLRASAASTAAGPAASEGPGPVCRSWAMLCRLTLAKMGGKRPGKKRQRGAQGLRPFAWGVLGEGGDFDQVGLGCGAGNDGGSGLKA